MAIPFRMVNKYVDEEMALHKIGEYRDGSTALEIIDKNGEEYATATVCIPGTDVPEGHVLIKDWSENEGVLQSLINAGIVGQPVRNVPSGFVTAQLVELLKDI